MNISDTIIVKNKKLSFTINDQGGFVLCKDVGFSIEYLVLIKSLDTGLTSNLLYINVPDDHDSWTYNWCVKPATLKNNHPGIKLEIYDYDHDKNINLIYKKNYRFDLTRLDIKLKSNQHDVIYDPFFYFLYDQEFKSLCNIKEDDVVYDLGANIGSFSLVCKNFDVKKVYAFEPNTSTFDCLVYNTDRYGENVTCFKKAISNSFKKVSFGNYCNNTLDDKTCSCSIVTDDKNLETVSAINLELFVYANDLELPTYLKVDIEGAEYEFFDSINDDFLKNCHTIFLEFHDRDDRLNKIIDRLTMLNYKMFFHDDEKYVLSQTMGTIFFVKQL